MRVKVLKITILVFLSNPQTLYQNVSANVAVPGLNAFVFASSVDGAEATAGVKMNDLAANPNRSVVGNSDTTCVLWAGATEGRASK